MQIDLTPEQDSFVRRALENGRFGRPEDAVQEALSAWVIRERKREDLLSAIHEAEASLMRGEGVPFTEESATSLVDDIHRRGLERNGAESTPKS